MMAVNKEDFFQAAPGSVPWSTAWQGPESVLYGHAVHDLSTPRVDEHDGYACYGIDTGCVYGGHLTAVIIDPDGGELTHVVSEKAKKQYYKPPKNWRVGRPTSSLD